MGKYSGIDLKSLRSKLEESASKSEEGGKGSFSSDFWKPTLEDKQKISEYEVRFLPNPDSVDGFPWVQRNAHMVKFATTGSFIYEPCPRTSKKGDCPICEIVNPGFKSGNPHEKDRAMAQYAKGRFFLNVYIIKDDREDGINVGKIKIIEVGKKIFEKLKAKIEAEKGAFAFFDLLRGANFKIIVTKEQDFPNYDKSDFVMAGTTEEPKIVYPLELVNGTKITEATCDKFMEGAFSLNEKLFTETTFKSYDELKSIYENQGYPKKEEDSSIKGRNPNPPQKIYPERVVSEDDLPFGKSEAPKAETPKTETPKASSVKKEEYKSESNSDEEAEIAALLANN